VDGRLFEPGDQPALAALLTELLGNADQRAHFGARARQRVEEAYRAELTAARYAALYARLAR
jgi:glycosyltransferase involved in cell wall biosynthesis